MKRTLQCWILGGLLACGAWAASANQGAITKVNFNIAAQPVGDALNALAAQTGLQVVLYSDQLAGLRAPAVIGDFTAQEALSRILANTAFRAEFIDAHTVAIIPHKSDANAASIADSLKLARAAAETSPSAQDRNEAANSTQGTDDEAVASDKGVPEILVKGRRTINADIKRTRDDIQPYVTFSSEEIRRSQASTLEDFFKTRLPMNAAAYTGAQFVNQIGTSAMDIRGLGANQTLILVDGRRLPNVSTAQGGYRQPYINGIPLASIERIEVLPSTASGIYGGGATGGVINIITRKDYRGIEGSLVYGNTEHSDAENYRVDFAGGWTLEEGRTHVLVSGGITDSERLILRDRDLVKSSRALQFTNNPGVFFAAATPPLGYQSNIRSQNGLNLVLKTGTNLGSPYTSVPDGYVGSTVDAGAGLVANAGRYDLRTPQIIGWGGEASVYSAPATRSASANIRRGFGDRIEAFVDFAWNRSELISSQTVVPTSVSLADTAPNNPFTTAITVSFPATGLAAPFKGTDESWRATGGAIVRLPRDWSVSADYVWSKSRQTQTNTLAVVGDPDNTGPGLPVTTALGNGTLNVLRDLNANPLNWSPYLLPSPNYFQGPSDNYMSDVTLRLSGPLFELPAGALNLATLAEHRYEKAADQFSDLMGANGVSNTTFLPQRSQTVDSLYLELTAPLVSQSNDRFMLRSLEVQASARHDSYETKSPNPASAPLASRSAVRPSLTDVSNSVDATKYTVGLKYSPIESVVLRASHGTGFLPPSIDQLVTLPLEVSTLSGNDPKRGNLPVTYTIDRLRGGNVNLKAEETESWSVGAVFTPAFAPGFRLSVDYTDIKKDNEIITLVDAQLFEFEDLLPGRLTRAPLSLQDQQLGYTGGIVTRSDRTLINLSSTQVEAWDFQAGYELQTANMGQFRFDAVATWQPKLARQVIEGAAVQDHSGYRNGVLEWRGNVGVTWNKGPWSVGWNAQYFDSYFVYSATTTSEVARALAVLNQGGAKVSSQTYHDAFVTFEFDAAAAQASEILRGTEITLGIQNVFDEVPPPLASTATVIPSAYSTYGDPRLRRYALTLRKQF